MQQQPYAVADADIGHDERPSWGARVGAFVVITLVAAILMLVKVRAPSVAPLLQAVAAAAIATFLADRIYRGVGSAGSHAALLILAAIVLNTTWGDIFQLGVALAVFREGDPAVGLALFLVWLGEIVVAFIVFGFIATYVPAVLRRRRERLAAADTDDAATADNAALQIPSSAGAAPQVQDYSQTPVAAPRRPREPFWSKHWRGGYPLDTSAWVLGILLTIVRVAFVILMMIGLYVAFDARGRGLMAALLILIFFDICVAVWQAVGICRSAANFIAQGGGRTIAVLAAGAVLLVVLVSTARDVIDVTGAVQTLSLRY